MKSRRVLAMGSALVLIVSLSAVGCALRKVPGAKKNEAGNVPAPQKAEAPTAAAVSNPLANTKWKSNCHGPEKFWPSTKIWKEALPGQITELHFEGEKRVKKFIYQFSDKECTKISSIDEFQGGYSVGAQISGKDFFVLNLNTLHVKSTPKDQTSVDAFQNSEDYKKYNWKLDVAIVILDEKEADFDIEKAPKEAGPPLQDIYRITEKDGKKTLHRGKDDPSGRPDALNDEVPYKPQL
jgi:hypothetical protein